MPILADVGMYSNITRCYWTTQPIDNDVISVAIPGKSLQIIKMSFQSRSKSVKSMSICCYCINDYLCRLILLVIVPDPSPETVADFVWHHPFVQYMIALSCYTRYWLDSLQVYLDVLPIRCCWATPWWLTVQTTSWCIMGAVWMAWWRHIRIWYLVVFKTKRCCTSYQYNDIINLVNYINIYEINH